LPGPQPTLSVLNVKLAYPCHNQLHAGRVGHTRCRGLEPGVLNSCKGQRAMETCMQGCDSGAKWSSLHSTELMPVEQVTHHRA
jgi:hypothetical protein